MKFAEPAIGGFDVGGSVSAEAPVPGRPFVRFET
jgi:hypothetical protein